MPQLIGDANVKVSPSAQQLMGVQQPSSQSILMGVQQPSSRSILMGGGSQAQPSVSGIATAPQQAPQPTQAQGTSSTDLEKELAEIRSISRAMPTGKGGIGQTVGGTLGTAAGAFFGEAETGGAIGEGVGSIVDYIIDSDAQEKAEQKRIDALKKEEARQKAMLMDKVNAESLARRRGIALSREEEALNAQNVTKANRANMLKKLLGSINQKAQFDDALKQKFIQSRSFV